MPLELQSEMVYNIAIRTHYLSWINDQCTPNFQYNRCLR